MSRGELIEIGDGFRLPDLVISTGARMREVGTTNRTYLRDYADAVGPETAAVLKVHPSNFHSGVRGICRRRRADGAGRAGRRRHRFRAARTRPAAASEPDAASTLRAGADLVTATCDKLLGGPQAGLILGGAPVPISWTGCAGTRSPAPSGSTSSPSPRSRRR